MCFADEDEIDKSDSLIIKDSNYETALISSLYFLLTGDYKEGVEEIFKSEVENEKKKAVVAYIEEQVAALLDKKVSYIMQLAVIAATENSVREEQAGISKNIAELTTRRKEISETIAERTLKKNDYRTNLQHYRDYTKL